MTYKRRKNTDVNKVIYLVKNPKTGLYIQATEEQKRGKTKSGGKKRRDKQKTQKHKKKKRSGGGNLVQATKEEKEGIKSKKRTFERRTNINEPVFLTGDLSAIPAPAVGQPVAQPIAQTVPAPVVAPVVAKPLTPVEKEKIEEIAEQTMEANLENRLENEENLNEQLKTVENLMPNALPEVLPEVQIVKPAGPNDQTAGPIIETGLNDKAEQIEETERPIDETGLNDQAGQIDETRLNDETGPIADQTAEPIVEPIAETELGNASGENAVNANTQPLQEKEQINNGPSRRLDIRKPLTNSLKKNQPLEKDYKGLVLKRVLEKERVLERQKPGNENKSDDELDPIIIERLKQNKGKTNVVKNYAAENQDVVGGKKTIRKKKKKNNKTVKKRRGMKRKKSKRSY
jgi:hypothetical protein